MKVLMNSFDRQRSDPGSQRTAASVDERAQTALAELATRMEGLEKAVREIAVEVQTLRAP